MSLVKISNQTCSNKNCDRKLKQSLVDKMPADSNPLCYKCYCKEEAKRGHTVNTKPRKKRLATGGLLPVKTFGVSHG